MTIKKLAAPEIGDFKSLIEIFKTVFENEETPAPDASLGRLLANPDFWVFVVVLNQQVVGGLTAYLLHPYFNTTPVVYLYDVAIAPDFQGRGLGQALLATVGQFCRENGFKEAYVAAETTDTAAVNFYRKTHFSHEMSAVHFTYTFDAKG